MRSDACLWQRVVKLLDAFDSFDAFALQMARRSARATLFRG